MAKRTLDAFFKPATNTSAKRPKPDPEKPEPRPPDTHPSYPIPIPQLPSHITTSLEHETPAHPGRSITNQPNLDLLYFQPCIPRKTANELFKFLLRELPLYRVQYTIKRNGLETSVNTPRYTTVFGVDETSTFIPKSEQHPSTSELILVNATSKTPTSPAKYQYAPRPIPSCLDTLRKQVELATNAKYNFCLVNYYASGEDSIAFHSDDERFLGGKPCIASLSLGGEREFVMKHKPSGSYVTQGQRVKLGLGSGDMVVMRGETQANWLHSVPKRKGDAVRGRINITFRRAVVPAGTNNYYNYNVGHGGFYRWDGSK